MRRAASCAIATGFTLFEVMAAVLVLGVLYTMLATTAIHGLRSEGESKRRLEASLLADENLMELEGGLAAGIFPEIGAIESEAGDFQVAVEVTPFDVTPFLGSDEEDGEPPGADSLLAPPDRPEESLLRLVTVAVRWDEAGGEREVSRTTLVYDQASFAGMFGDGGADTAADEVDEDQFVNPDGTPNLEAMMERLRQVTGEEIE